jgi:hypothetical protein
MFEGKPPARIDAEEELGGETCESGDRERQQRVR